MKPIDGSDQTDHPKFRERLGFDGKRLADWFVLSIYRTKAGKLIVTDNLRDAEGAIFGYRVYDQLAELRNDRAITNLEEDEQTRLWDMLSEPLPPPVVTTWID